MGVGFGTVQQAASRRRWIEYWCLLYLVLLLLAPPMLQDLPFVARGMKADQVLVYVSLSMLLLCTRRMRVASDGRLWLEMAAIYAATAWLTMLLTPWSYDDVDILVGAVSALGSSRPFFIGLTVALMHNSLDETNLKGATSEQRFLKHLTISFALIGVIPLIVGILQYLGVTSVVALTARYYGRARVPTDPTSFRLRVYGTFDGQENSFGTYAAVYALMLAGFVLGGLKGANRWRYSLLSAVGLIACLLSGSRGAYVALFLGFLSLLILLKPTTVRIIQYMGGAGVLAAVAYSLVRPSTRQRVQMVLDWAGYGGRGALDDRWPYWMRNLAIWSRSPIFGGRGIENAPPDNLLVGLLVTGGLLGLVAFGLLLVISLVTLVRRYRHKGSWAGIWAANLISVTVLLLVNGVSIPSFFVERVGDLYWFLLGTLVFSRRLHQEGQGNVECASRASHIA